MTAKYKIGDIIFNKDFNYEILDVKWFPNNIFGYKLKCLAKPADKEACFNNISYFRAKEIEIRFKQLLTYNYNKLWNNLNV